MSNIPKILSLPLIEVLAKLGYGSESYVIHGNNIKMKEGGKVTNGWNGELQGADGNGFLKCHSGKKPGRFEGDNLKMVEDKLGLTKAEAIKWFEEQFNIETEKKKYEPSVADEFNNLPKLSDEQISYLHSRKIKYSLIEKEVRDYQGSIALAIKTENGRVTSFQGRNIKEEGKKNRYRIRPGGGAKGLFADFDNINSSEDVFIVEGMTDYLTLRQFTGNVIAIVAKGNGIESLQALKNKYKFIIIPDNDLGGEEVLEKLKDINMGVFRLSSYSEGANIIKDVNDLWNKFLSNGMTGEELLEVIRDECKKPLTNIELALQKAIRNRDNVGWHTGEKTFDWATGGIVPGTTFLINGPSSQGKTTWAMWILMKMLKQNKKIGFYSLETDAGKMLAQVLGYAFGENWRKEIYPNIEKYLKEYGVDNLKNLFLFDDIRNLNDIERSIQENDLDIAFIDYAQIMDGLPGKSPKEQMGEYAKRVQQIARDNYVCMISLSQTPKNEEHDVPVLYRTPMEAQALKSAADTMINVGIYKGIHKIGFVKCKEGDDDAWRTEFDTTWNKQTGEIGIFKDEGYINKGF